MKELKGLDFWDACRIVAGTERRISYKCISYTFNYTAWDSSLTPFLCNTETGKPWWPSPDEAREKVWEVEEEKPEEGVTVFGVCDVDGESYIYSKYPRQLENKNWESQGPEKDFMALAANNLFPKDKPQKYKLAPVEAR